VIDKTIEAVKDDITVETVFKEPGQVNPASGTTDCEGGLRYE